MGGRTQHECGWALGSTSPHLGPCTQWEQLPPSDFSHLLALISLSYDPGRGERPLLMQLGWSHPSY